MAAMEAQMAAWITELETEHDTVEIKPFPFDPNTIGREEWRALGLTDKQIDGLERYQNKGGHFRTKKDLGRMYSIKPELFARLGTVHPLAGQPHPVASIEEGPNMGEGTCGTQRALPRARHSLRVDHSNGRVEQRGYHWVDRGTRYRSGFRT